jgi:DNA-binding beta-propeller fold protein YncE
MPFVDTDAPIGTQMLGYDILAVLGRGGMGVVYRAHDSRLKRNVALKLLLAESATDAAFRERLLRESELAASLDHPNVIPIYEAGEADGRLFIAMRYVEGPDLKRALADGPLSPGAAIDLAGQVAGALDTAHALGLVHRDVKPSNVLIARGAGRNGSDHVYLSDFGLTRRLTDLPAGSTAEPLHATIDYVAPEQIRGEHVDGRADVYSFGCLVYECLVGAPPFRASSDAALLFAHLEAEPPRPSDYGLPVALDAVVRRALAKAPEDRHASATELVEDVRAALGVAVAPASRRQVAVPFLALGLVVAVATGVALVLSHHAGALRTPAASADRLLRIDPTQNRVVSEQAVGRGATAVTTGGGYVWVANRSDDMISRIEPKTHAVLAIPAHGMPAALAVSGRSALIVDGPGNDSLVSVDVPTAAVTSVESLPGDGGAVPAVAGSGQSLWVADPEQRSLTRSDLRGRFSGSEIVTAIPAGNGDDLLSKYVSFDGLAVGDGAIWIAGDPLGRKIWRVSQRTNKLVATIDLPFAPGGIAVGAGSVWVTSLLGDTVSRIDAASNRIVSRISVGRGAGAVAVGDGSVWVANTIDRTVSKIDARSNAVLSSIPVSVTPDSIAVDATGIWVVGGRR